MKNLKKLALAALATFAVVFASTLTVSANVTADEQKIIDVLKAAGVPAEYVTLAQQHLGRSDVTLDAAAVTAVVAKVEEAKALVAEGGSIAAVLADDTLSAKLVTLVTAAGKSAGVDVVVDLDDPAASKVGGLTLGALVANPDKVNNVAIRNTGSDFTSTLVLCAGLISLLGVAAVVAKKKELF